MIILDTNAVIYYLQNEKRAVAVIEALRKKEETFSISSITEMEVFSFQTLTEENIVAISIWLNDLFVIGVDSAVAREAAKLRRKYKLKSPDAIIAATAILFNAELVTRDKELLKVTELKTILC